MPITVNHEFTLSFAENRIFRAGVFDLLGVMVDGIVNPANSGLSHGGGLAAAIADEAGPRLEKQCRTAVKKLGRIPVTHNVATTAGDLPYKGVIHAVGPRMGDGDEQVKLERTVLNCLKAADIRGWKSLALPAVSTGLFLVPEKTCAQAFRQAVPRYWKNNPESGIELIWLCLTIDDYPVFDSIFNSRNAHEPAHGGTR